MNRLPHKLMHGRCRYCGRPLRYANIPNRGSVMAHAKGAGEFCRRLRERGLDAVSQSEKAKS